MKEAEEEGSMALRADDEQNHYLYMRLVKARGWRFGILDAVSFIVWIETANDQLILLHIN